MKSFKAGRKQLNTLLPGPPGLLPLAIGFAQSLGLTQYLAEDKRLPGSAFPAQLLDDGVDAVPAA